jgi:dihydroorotase
MGGGMLVGEAADIAVFDLESQFTVDPDTFHSMGRSTPFKGWELEGECVMTLVDGKVVYEK